MAKRSEKKTAQDLLALLDHAKKVKSPYVDTAKEARAVYASDWNDSDQVHWNFYRAQRDNYVSRCIEGEPRAQAAARNTEMGEVFKPATTLFSEDLDTRYAAEMIAALLREAQGDTSDSGVSWWHVTVPGDVISVSFFDVWVDNIHSRVSSLEDCRYLFWQRTMDVNAFKIEFAADLKKIGVKPDDITPSEVDLTGHEPVGGQPGRDIRLNEDTTGHLTDTFGNSVVTGHAPTNTADEGLVVFIEAWCQDEDAESGYMKYWLWDDKIIRTEEWPAHIGELTWYCFGAAELKNQLYQSSDYNHSRGYMHTIDKFVRRISQNSDVVADPVAMVTSATKALNSNGITFKPGALIETAGQPDGEVSWAPVPPIPVMYIQFLTLLKEFAHSLELPDVLQGQTDQTDVQSGKAIRELRSEANQRLRMRVNNQEENLRKVAKMLCKIILHEYEEMAKMNAAAALRDQVVAEIEAEEEAGYGMMVTDPESIPMPPVESVQPQVWQTFMPEQLQGITSEVIDRDLAITWSIVPHLQREDRVEKLSVAFQTAALIPGVNMDPIAFLTMAGEIAGEKRMAAEWITAYQQVQPLVIEAQAAQMAMAAEQQGEGVNGNA